MKWFHPLTVAFLASMLVPSVQAQKDKKKDDPKKPAEAIDAEKLKPGQVKGKLTAASDNRITVRVDIVHYELNQPRNGGKVNYKGNGNEIQQLLRQQEKIADARADLMRARNPREQARAAERLQAASAQMQQQAVKQQLQALAGKNGGQNLFKEVHETKDVDIGLDDSCLIRFNFLPQVYDETGNYKKFTEEEKKEMKGDPKLPGYKAGTSDLKFGQKVVVTLSKNKETENKTMATFVIITEESNETVKTTNPKKKK